ncbi:MAG: hypothetical protein ABIR11_13830 [Candidatus Limnocylindrales bacterium]
MIFGTIWLSWSLLSTPGIGIDRTLYMSATERWLSGGGFYLPDQLTGPYVIHLGIARDVLYPPILLWLTVPLFYLPPILWWAIPMGATMWGLIRLRPAPWTWPLILGLALFPASWLQFAWGGPSMWVLAFGALGAAYGWPAVLILIKPTLAPFALFGANHRSWWAALGILALLSLPFGTMWLDWIRAAVVNPTNGGFMYSWAYVPAMCVPVVAWLGRRPADRPVGRCGQRPASNPKPAEW